MHYHNGALDEGEEEDDIVHQHYCNTEGEGPGSSGGVNNTELTQNEQVITSPLFYV